MIIKIMNKNGNRLIILLKNYTNIIVKYGYYNCNDLLMYASESTCVIYYLFLWYWSYYSSKNIVYAIVLLKELEYNIQNGKNEKFKIFMC